MRVSYLVAAPRPYRRRFNTACMLRLQKKARRDPGAEQHALNLLQLYCATGCSDHAAIPNHEEAGRLCHRAVCFCL